MKQLFLLFLFFSLLFADTITLKDGTILNGYVAKRDLRHISFVTKESTHYVPYSKIKSYDLTKQFTRIENNELQVKVLRLRKNGKIFTICSAIHIGDKSYYRQLESILDKNQLVLFEAFGVNYNLDFSVWKIPPFRYHDEIPRYTALPDNLSRTAELLGLDLQIEELQTFKPFWEPSDISNSKFKWLLQQRIAKGLFSYTPPDKEQSERNKILQKGFNHVYENPHDRKALKKLKKLYAYDTVKGEVAPKTGAYIQTVLFDRNKQIIQDILECTQNKDLKTIGVIYGAYHMEDIVLNLRRAGFVFVEEFWIPAWKL